MLANNEWPTSVASSFNLRAVNGNDLSHMLLVQSGQEKDLPEVAEVNGGEGDFMKRTAMRWNKRPDEVITKEPAKGKKGIKKHRARPKSPFLAPSDDRQCSPMMDGRHESPAPFQSESSKWKWLGAYAVGTVGSRKKICPKAKKGLFGTVGQQSPILANDGWPTSVASSFQSESCKWKLAWHICCWTVG
ncbi:hypothetical protein CEXT_308781 [Caerostris extrusa]|uniref:Uncharacterized protein n=1 Tax=Caerostris extrusa TaxID=172846 RepID=A0AAV4WM63_CAEEX|nr:hypothetical protein CEXT_308781 [Caerostris extrusa]